MNRALDIIAKILSVVLYPLFIPTYGIVLFCVAQAAHVASLPWIWVLIAIVGTLVLTCILPVTTIWIMMRRGVVKDLYIDDPRQRTMPYLYSCLGFGFWAYLLAETLHAPLFLVSIAIGATVAIGLVSIINRWWKISAHLTGMGGLLGGIMSYCLGIGAIPTWGTWVVLLGLSWLLMVARLRLDAHTGAQVSTGWLLGMICTFVPYLIMSHV